MSVCCEFLKQVLNARTKRNHIQEQLTKAIFVFVGRIQKIKKETALPGLVVMLRQIIFLELGVENLRKEVELFVSV